MALTTVPASLSATALTLTTAAQPNITSVGTLTGLTVGGTISIGDWTNAINIGCLLYTSPSPRDRTRSRMPSSA